LGIAVTSGSTRRRYGPSPGQMTYQLHGSDGSGSGIVEMALAELGVAYELHEVSLRTEQQRSSEYAQLNPQRKLPTLITPSGEVLTESAAIVLVLEERHPDAGLLPARGSPERAQALRWLVFMAAELYPLIEICDYPERFAPDAATAPAVREVAHRTWQRRWSLVESAIRGAPWFMPSGFSAVDLYLAVLSRWSLDAAWRAAQVPKVEAIASAVAQRPRSGPIWHRHHGHPDQRLAVPP
jgi:GST-like protein